MMMEVPRSWADQIPRSVQNQIGDAVRSQSLLLPVNLFIEWHQPCTMISRRWFHDASRYIAIPYPEYWQTDEGDRASPTPQSPSVE